LTEPVTAREEIEKSFLATPDAIGLVKLYLALQEEARDDLLAALLNKVRPIQHRVTLIQADAEPLLLEALCRDPHAHVRQVVAGHANINEEVCLRLCEDPQHPVRLALRKNPRCHPVIRAALVAQDRRGASDLPSFETFLEIAWQARRAALSADQLGELIEEWVDVAPDDLEQMTTEQANKILDVLAGQLGQGPMPRKPSGSKASKKSRRTKKRS